MSFNVDELNLTIDLLPINLELTRGKNFNGPSRERVTGEKYFRQAIQIYNKEGNLVDSGFVQINDYTNMCRMVRVCNKSKKTYHLFEKWEHCGENFYKTNKFTVIDLATGETVGLVFDSYVEEYIENVKAMLGDSCYLVGDLEKDEYSKILLECLNEYSNSNMPLLNKIQKKRFEEATEEACECNLLEKLNIEDLFRNCEIDEERKQLLYDSLVCNCKNKPLDPELTEEQKSIRAELRLKAQNEIYEVLFIKETESEVANMV